MGFGLNADRMHQTIDPMAGLKLKTGTTVFLLVLMVYIVMTLHHLMSDSSFCNSTSNITSYNERLKHLNLRTLNYRRLQVVMIELYRIIHCT